MKFDNKQHSRWSSNLGPNQFVVSGSNAPIVCEHRAKWYFFLKFFIPGTILLIIAGLIIYFAMINNIRTKYLRYAKQRTYSEEQFQEIFLSEHLADAELLAKLVSDNENLHGNQVNVSHIFQLMGQSHPVYDQVRVLNSDGYEIIRYNRGSNNFVRVPDSELQDKSERYYVKDGLNAPGTYVSPLDLNVEHGQVETPLKPVLRVSSRIQSASVSNRLIILNINATALFERFEQFERDSAGDIWMVNRQGFFLHGPRSKLDWRFMFEDVPIGDMATLYPQVWEHMERTPHGGVFSTSQGIFVYRLVQVPQENARPVTMEGWWLISYLPSTLLHPVSSLFWVSLMALAIVLLAASCWYYAGSRCTTEQATMDLYDREQRLSAIFDHAAMAIFVVGVHPDGSFTIDDINAEHERITGCKRERIRNKALDEFVPQLPQEVIEQIKRRYQDCVDRQQAITYEEMLPINGQETWWLTRISPIKNSRGTIYKLIGCSSEINLLKTNQKELADLRDHLQDLVAQRTDELEMINRQLQTVTRAVEQSPTSVVITDEKGNITYVNPSFTNVTGYTLDDVLHQNPRILKSGHHDPSFYAAMWETLSSGRSWHGDLVNRRKDGSSYWESASISPVLNQKGQITHYVAVKMDVTAQKENEEALRQARDDAEAANRAKSTFLANMSHEIRTPLNAILGFAQILANDTGFTASQLDHIRTISRSGEHLLTLINDILDLAKIEAGHVKLIEKPFKLHDLLRDCIDMFRIKAKEKGIDLRLDYLSKVPLYVIGDEGRLRQILINLIGNAVKFTKHGEVCLQVTSCDEQKLYTCFIIKDTGIGIPEEQLNVIFQPFEQTEVGNSVQGGTGLGLAITRHYIQLMNGEISVDSTLGQGSAFRFSIPLKKYEVVEPAHTADSHLCADEAFVGQWELAPDQPPLSVLVVDDQPDNQHVLRVMLERTGCTVDVAADGKQAVECWEIKHHSFIFMDIAMPVMGGLEAIQTIRNLPDGLAPVIVIVTASAFEEDATLTDNGADDFISKPVQQSRLYQVIHNQGVELVTKNYQYASSSTDTLSVLNAAIDSDTATALKTAAQTADIQQLNNLIESIRSHNPQSAQILQDAVNKFDYQMVLTWLQQTERNGNIA